MFDKHLHTFTVFDIESFYPSISDKLLTNAIHFAIHETHQDHQLRYRYYHALQKINSIPQKRQRRFVWRNDGKLWRMQVCKLIGLSILNDLANKYWTNNIELYRDEGLAIFKNTTGPQIERTQKEITRRFKEHGPKITIQSNLKSLDYLDVTLNLTNGLFQPYRKPNDEPLYIITNTHRHQAVTRNHQS